MGKLALLAVVVFSTLGALTAMHRTGGLMDASERVADKQYEVLARNAALAGFNRAKQGLADSFSDGTVSGEADGVSYSVTVSVAGDNAVVTSTGTTTGSNGEDIDYEVRAEFTRVVSGIPADPPAFMTFGILSQDDLVLRGDIEGGIDVQGDEASELNANMHTNGNLTVMGNSARVEGFGTFVGSGSGHLANTFNPNYNPAGLDDAYQASAVDIPLVDIPTWMSNVSADRNSPSSVVLSGEYSDGGTRNNPFVWLINGDLNVTSDAVINGYTMFIVDGSVEFNGDLTVGDSGYEGPIESSIAVYSSGGIDFTGNQEIEAQMYSEGDVIMGRGTPVLRGSITTRSMVEFRGTPDILYRPASPALTTNWVPASTVITMTGYHER